MSFLLTFAAQAAEQVCTTPGECANQGVDTFVGTPARIWASVAALVALGGVVLGGLALARSRRRIGNGGRRWAIAALLAGLTGVVNGVVNLAVADGGPGTGNGVVGGTVALILGLLAVVLGGRARTRARRNRPDGTPKQRTVESA